MPDDDENSRHRREEADRKAKRKANKITRSEAQIEKERKSKAYRQEILRQQGHSGSKSRSSSSDSNKKKSSDPSDTTFGDFQKLFTARAQGFHIEFAFRNAPPRPPVGPCFVGDSLDATLDTLSAQYRPWNAVEMNHKWKLHSEEDIGVPLAPSAMDPNLYQDKDDSNDVSILHPDDEALLNWKGSMGDSTEESQKRKREAAARLLITGKKSPAPAIRSTGTIKMPTSKHNKRKVASSRVLPEEYVPWMKKTTYLSNDYSRKVHDFTSLAQTNTKKAADIQQKQKDMAARRTAGAIRKSFDCTEWVHPTNKNLKPKNVLPVLPSVANWGRNFTHCVMENPPAKLDAGYKVADLSRGLVTDVKKVEGFARMTCDIQVPAVTPPPKEVKEKDNEDDEDKEPPPAVPENAYRPLVSYDIEVVPLKNEDDPHTSFSFWINGDKNVVYVPVPSRIQMSTGRPSEADTLHPVERRPLTDKELKEVEERACQVDRDLAAKYGKNDNDDGEDDDVDSDDSE